jgi:hypothetical protein
MIPFSSIVMRGVGKKQGEEKIVCPVICHVTDLVLLQLQITALEWEILREGYAYILLKNLIKMLKANEEKCQS